MRLFLQRSDNQSPLARALSIATIIVALLTIALTLSCATPSLAFAAPPRAAVTDGTTASTGTASEVVHPDVVDAVSALSADAPFAPSAPAQPSEAGGAAVALPEEPEEHTLDALTEPSRDSAIPEEVHAVPVPPTTAVVDAWIAKHLPGLGAHLTEYLHGRLLAAFDDLKALLLELPIS